MGKIMLVQSAPGRPREEDQISRLLTAANVVKEHCIVDYLVKDRPAQQNYGGYYADKKGKQAKEDLVWARAELLKRIKLANPSVVVAFGAEAAKAIIGRGDIESIRGSVYAISGTDVSCVPTFDANAILKGGGTSHWYSPAAIHDLIRAKDVASGKVKAHEPGYKVVSDPVELDKWFAKVTECAFDIETTWRGGEGIRCIGFAASPDSAVVVNFEDLNPKMLDLLAVIRRHMTAGKIGWIGQNAYNFDIPMIQKIWGFEVRNLICDTMVIHHMLYPEFPHNLATIASFYCTIPFWKDTSDENLHKYNAYDAVSTYIVARSMLAEAKERGWGELYSGYYNALLKPLRVMSQRGMRIDLEYQQKLKGELKDEAKILQMGLDGIYATYAKTEFLANRGTRIDKLIAAKRKTVKLPNKKTGKFQRKRLTSLRKAIDKAIKKAGTLNVRSTKDLAAFLYGTLKLPKKTKQGKVTTDVTALNQLYIKSKHPFLKTMIKLRTTRNMLSRWGNLKVDEKGLIGTTYSFADTGRLKSGKFEAK